MKTLILGGTRFLGKKIVQSIINEKIYNVTVISRKADVLEGEYIALKYEKKYGLQKLKDKYFDVVIDFIAYDKESVKVVLTNIKFKKYIVISSCWINKLNSSYRMNQFIEDVNDAEFNNLPEVTRNYLLNKRDIEIFVSKNINRGNYNIIRLPIIFGEGDHTKRLDFYVSRFKDQKGLIVVNGGDNYCQVGYLENISNVLLRYFKSKLKIDDPILEALPSQSLTVRESLLIIKEASNSKSELKSFSQKILKDKLPEYLDKEPLWREKRFERTQSNLFELYNFDGLPLQNWLRNETRALLDKNHNEGFLRSEELKLINKSL